MEPQDSESRSVLLLILVGELLVLVALVFGVDILFRMGK